MFTIRRIFDDVIPVNKDAIRQAQEIMRSQFADVRPHDVDSLCESLRNPFPKRFRTVLLVAESRRRRVLGFASVMHDPVARFCFLDFVASRPGRSSRGIGGALYEQVRDEARALGAEGLFFECLPDDPATCPTPSLLRANRARLRFYERYGVRPIEGTDYQRPISPDDTGMPFLMADVLGRTEPLRRSFVKKVVRAVLERKYDYLCPPEYVEAVVRSIREDPVRLRSPRYGADPVGTPLPAAGPRRERVVVVVNDKHQIHHVRERGYVEAPVRIPRILSELEKADLVEVIPPRAKVGKAIRAVHAADFVDYLRRACAKVGPGASVYPYVFPVRNSARPPRELSVRAGYFCLDTFTPLNSNAWLAARRAVECSLTAAEQVLHGRRVAYALVRPPGHHAERRNFGGFCYFNNNAIAANRLSQYGRVAILDVDYHHGNGQQDIFYERDDVLTLSIHGHPSFAYPYFSGFSNERGLGSGEGYNVNLPLKEELDGEGYRKALRRALGVIRDYRPDFLVVALGLDTAKNDPTGTWSLGGTDFYENGRLIADLSLPILVVQEGGYRTRTLGTNALAFLTGLLDGKPV